MRNLPHPQGPLRRPLNINRRTFLQALAGLTAAVGIFSPLTPLGAAMPTSAAGRPGARNLITDVPGLKVGVAQDSRVRTGATVIL
ncbi:TPA: twin-arginine translocation signal domain-containing protein, partial [Serratia marcescens]|nr:twin-arginine translocation signal domain-containing protein [Serratia marcescens]